jgi:hypothetical protein
MKTWVPAVYRGVVWPYAVSSDGEVMSIGRGCGRGFGKILKQIVTQYGYRAVSIANHPTIIRCLVHRLVVESFNGPIPAGLEVNHIDFDRANNRVDNLEIVTGRANKEHTKRHGRQQHGEGHYNSRLTAADVVAIRGAAAGDESFRSIAKRHGVTHEAIRKIVRGLAWAHV